MQNHYHAEINRNQLVYTHRPTPEFTGMLSMLRRYIRKVGVRELVGKAREAASYCLATLAVSSLFLGGVYLFLVQLAHHGW